MLLKDFSEEQEFCGYIAEKQTRSRAVANIVGIKTALEFFKSCGLGADVTNSAYKIKKFLEELDIADVYVGDLRFDVRLSTVEGEYLIPKKHFELNIIPDLYMFVYYDKISGEAQVVGFVAPNEIDKTQKDDYYYYVSKETIASFEDTAALFDSLVPKAKDVLPLNLKKRAVLYFDGLLDEKQDFFAEVINSEKARELVLEFSENERLLKRTNFTFAVMDAELDALVAEEFAQEEPDVQSLSEEELDLGFADGLGISQTDLVLEESAEEEGEGATELTDLDAFINDTEKEVVAVVDALEEEQLLDIEPVESVEEFEENSALAGEENSAQEDLEEEVILEEETFDEPTPELSDISEDVEVQVEEPEVIESSEIDIEDVAVDEDTVLDIVQGTEVEEPTEVELEEEVEDSVLELSEIVEDESEQIEESEVEDLPDFAIEGAEEADEDTVLDIVQEAEVNEPTEVEFEEEAEDSVLELSEVAEDESEQVEEPEVEDVTLDFEQEAVELQEEQAMEDFEESEEELLADEEVEFASETEEVLLEDESEDNASEVDDLLVEEDAPEPFEELEFEDDSEELVSENDEFDLSIDEAEESLELSMESEENSEELLELDEVEGVFDEDAEMAVLEETVEPELEAVVEEFETESSEYEELSLSFEDEEEFVPPVEQEDIELSLAEEKAVEPSIDIKATMEGFVNSLEPEDGLALKSLEEEIEPDEAPKESSVSETESVVPEEELASVDDSDLEAVAVDDETVNVVEQEAPAEHVEESVDEQVLEQSSENEEINELYQAPVEETEIEEVVSYKKPKPAGSGAVAGVLLFALVAAGACGYFYKDLIMEKISGNSAVESIPNELATPTETTASQQVKVQKKKVQTEAQQMLDDIEEPVQLLDSSVSVSALTVDCDVPSVMVNNYSRRYLIKLSKRMQLQLRNALLIAGEQPLANKIVVDLVVDKDLIKYDRVSSSSGSKKVDEITSSTAESVLKDTQPYAGTFGKNSGIIRLIIKF